MRALRAWQRLKSREYGDSWDELAPEKLADRQVYLTHVRTPHVITSPARFQPCVPNFKVINGGKS